jgi:RHS repeat-associated protein
VASSYAYDPFGQILSQQETAPQPFKYVGQYGVMAEPNGLYYMKARYYDSSVGRFISQDPLGFGGGDINLYNYVGGDPVNRIDPLGLMESVCEEEDCPGTIHGIIGGAPHSMGDSIPELPAGRGGTSWSTARSNYWKGRAACAQEGEFSPENMERMETGKGPKHDECGVTKELHHKTQCREGGSHDPENLQEVWPWEHEAIDPFRHYRGPRPVPY